MKVYIYREADGHVVFHVANKEAFTKLTSVMGKSSFKIPSMFSQNNSQLANNPEAWSFTVREGNPNRLYFWSFTAKNGTFGIECGGVDKALKLLSFLNLSKKGTPVGTSKTSNYSDLFYHSEFDWTSSRLSFPKATEEKSSPQFIDNPEYCVEFDTETGTWAELKLSDCTLLAEKTVEITSPATVPTPEASSATEPTKPLGMKSYLYKQSDGHMLIWSPLNLANKTWVQEKVELSSSTHLTRNPDGLSPIFLDDNGHTMYFLTQSVKDNEENKDIIYFNSRDNIAKCFALLGLLKWGTTDLPFDDDLSFGPDNLLSVPKVYNNQVNDHVHINLSCTQFYGKNSDYCLEIDFATGTIEEKTLPEVLKNSLQKSSDLSETEGQKLPLPTLDESKIKFETVEEQENVNSLRIVFASKELCTQWLNAYNYKATKLGCANKLSLIQEEHCLRFPVTQGPKYSGVSTLYTSMFGSEFTQQLQVKLPHAKLTNFFKDSFGIKFHHLNKDASTDERLVFKNGAINFGQESAREILFNLDIEYVKNKTEKASQASALCTSFG